MADLQVGNPHGVTAASIGGANTPSNVNGATSPQEGFFNTNLHDIGAMRTRLAAIDGTYYTATRLNKMSANDMAYAIRLADNPTTFKQP